MKTLLSGLFVCVCLHTYSQLDTMQYLTDSVRVLDEVEVRTDRLDLNGTGLHKQTIGQTTIQLYKGESFTEILKEQSGVNIKCSLPHA